jgi:hypothetical protein
MFLSFTYFFYRAKRLIRLNKSFIWLTAVRIPQSGDDDADLTDQEERVEDAQHHQQLIERRVHLGALKTII